LAELRELLFGQHVVFVHQEIVAVRQGKRRAGKDRAVQQRCELRLEVRRDEKNSSNEKGSTGRAAGWRCPGTALESQRRRNSPGRSANSRCVFCANYECGVQACASKQERAPVRLHTGVYQRRFHVQNYMYTCILEVSDQKYADEQKGRQESTCGRWI
jgi:hypothetical protein